MSKKILQAAAGAAGGESVYVEDVFSTYLYEGNDSNGSTEQEIVNGLDLSTEGGMVWMKSRDNTRAHCIYDTERGNGYFLDSSTSAEHYLNTTSPVWRPTTTGFYTGRDYGGSENQNGESIVSWSFRKQAGFFDVVTYTGDGTEGQTINHNLGSTPGFIIIKRTNGGTNWTCHHRSLGTTKVLTLNSLSAATNETRITNVGSTSFDVSSSSKVGGTGGTYVAYIFAHDDQSFGDDSDEAIIKCGSYTGTGGTSSTSVNLGFEPQFVFIMNASYGTYNLIYDSMRGIYSGSNDPMLHPNSSNAEDGTYGSSNDLIDLDPTGFTIKASGYDVTDRSASTFVYMAIRRPMKTPEAGTDVFSPYAYQDTTLTSGSGTASNRVILNGGVNDGTNFPVDLFMAVTRTGNHPYALHVFDRLRGKGKSLLTNATTAEPAGDGATNGGFDFQEGVDVEYNGFAYYYTTAAGNRTLIAYFLKRATGFFDVVAYTGNGTAGRTVSHNLGVSPEMIIVKKRNGATYWSVGVFVSGVINFSTPFKLNTSDAPFSDNPFNYRTTAQGADAFEIGSAGATNASGDNFIAYLFGTVAGVSKVGSYSGTGSNVDVSCGFSAGARFVLIKRTDSTGDWYYWDSARGIIAGNDPYQLANSTAAEVTSTDYIDPLSSGFTVTSSAPAALNASGGTYIFLAIA